MIDCDVHQNFNSVRDLLPSIDAPFRPYLERGGYAGQELPTTPGSTRAASCAETASRPAAASPGSDYDTLRRQLLDPHDVEYAILTGEDMLNVSCMAHPQLAAALATATTGGWSRPGCGAMRG